MTTVQEVFDIAIHLMDEQDEGTGATLTEDTQEYRLRTISILNALVPSLFPYSDTSPTGTPGRPAVPVLANINGVEPDFSQIVPLDDTLCRAVLPYGLAGHLTATENEELSAWFLNRYVSACADLRSRIPGTFQPIHAPYGFF